MALDADAHPPAARPTPPPHPDPPGHVRRPHTELILAEFLVAAILLFGIYRFTSRPPNHGGDPAIKLHSNPAPTREPAPMPKSQPANSGDAEQYPQVVPGSDPHDPIIGCYMWFNGNEVEIVPGGMMTDGHFPGIWKQTSPAHYDFNWPPMIVTVKMSQDMDGMSLSNQYGYSWTGARTNTNLVLGFPIEGTWHWSNGWDVEVGHEDDGNLWFKSGSWSGIWRGTDDMHTYTMQWPAPVDSVQMIDSDHIVGANQYGVQVQGFRNGKCR